MKKFLNVTLFLIINLASLNGFAQVAPPSDYDKQCSTTIQQKNYWWGTGSCRVWDPVGVRTATISTTVLLTDKNELRSVIRFLLVGSAHHVFCSVPLPNSTTVSVPTEICTYQPRQPFTSVSIDNPTCLNGNLVGSLNWSMNVGETFEVQTRNRPNSQWASASWITYSGYSVTLFGSPYGTNGERLDFRVRLSSNGKTGSWSESASMSGNCWGVDTP